MSTIVGIDISHHRLPLDPPFPASWDPRPRTHFPATIVRVTDDAGRVGVGSGDAMYGFDDYRQHFIGQDPLDLERHHAVLSNIEFHAGRPWPLDVALWDLAGQIREQPVWQLLGGRGRRVRAYASSGVHRSVDDMVAVAERAVALGFPALKVRFGRPELTDDLAVVTAVRAATGDRLELMVDCNQGWRMPWDTQAPWDLERATEVAEVLAAEGVYWMEEPLHRGDYAGHAELRRRVPVADRRGRDDPRALRVPGAARARAAWTSSSRTASAPGGSPAWPSSHGRSRRPERSSRRTPGATASACWPTCT